jgi:hypothetical protein
MTGSTCILSAETAVGDTGALTEGGKKPRAPGTAVKLTAEAYDVATTRAREAGTNRKTVVSELILKNRASPIANADLPDLIANSYSLAELYLAQLKRELEAGTLKVSVGGLERLVNLVVKLNSIREKSSSGAPANPAKLKEACYPPEYLKAYHERLESSAAGEQPETW